MTDAGLGEAIEGLYEVYGVPAPCPGCDERGEDIRQLPDGDLVCTRCDRVVSSVDTAGRDPVPE